MKFNVAALLLVSLSQGIKLNQMETGMAQTTTTANRILHPEDDPHYPDFEDQDMGEGQWYINRPKGKIRRAKRRAAAVRRSNAAKNLAQVEASKQLSNGKYNFESLRRPGDKKWVDDINWKKVWANAKEAGRVQVIPSKMRNKAHIGMQLMVNQLRLDYPQIQRPLATRIVKEFFLLNDTHREWGLESALMTDDTFQRNYGRK